ncbi:secreted and transmembrane protein 1A-like [Acomys russatus]|uniref:secreted and transmembrane protein 1A-like n=1 Tax=Acomys russatus TaxID=60746 RepID=UPI0021E204BC|nr:secreted and transmembrane protein 1A-like [Acomys russatus]
MLSGHLMSTVPASRLFIILLLVVSLNAHNRSWDNPVCTSGTVSVPRGGRAVMTCNISNTFADVTIWLIAQGRERTIFNKMPQGRFSQSGWELRVQEGQAELAIKDTQDGHTGLYQWRLHGRQKCYRNITLNISGEARAAKRGEASNKNEVIGAKLVTPISDAVMSAQLEVSSETLVGIVVAVVTVILILGLAGISACICYKRHRSRFSLLGIE